MAHGRDCGCQGCERDRRERSHERHVGAKVLDFLYWVRKAVVRGLSHALGVTVFLLAFFGISWVAGWDIVPGVSANIGSS